MPAAMPTATCVAAPIQPFSSASFRKYETPTSTATIPMRLSHCPPTRDSSDTADFVRAIGCLPTANGGTNPCCNGGVGGGAPSGGGPGEVCCHGGAAACGDAGL